MSTSPSTTRPPSGLDPLPAAPRARPTMRQLAREILDLCRDLPIMATAPLYRRWHLHWGATPREMADPMAGDDAFPGAQYRSTRAITIDAPPEEVWPWLVQVGCQRAGFYSNDLLDNLATPSATSILPRYQALRIGQWVPMSPSAPPTDRTALKVHSFQVNRWLLWHMPSSTWSWRLTPTDRGGTRLVTRIHAVYDWKHHPLTALVGLILMEFGDFPMLRRMLRGIKVRAETRPPGRVVVDRKVQPAVTGAPSDADHWLTRSVGAATVAFTLVYVISDVLEVVQGDFSDARLGLTYAGEAAIPLFVMGL